MSAEGLASSAAIAGLQTGTGVAMAGLMFTADQSLGMGAIAGAFMFCAASATLGWGSKILYAIGSIVLGYFAGILALYFWSNVAAGAIMACMVSALASFVVGSLKRWSDGGPRPDWVDWAGSLLPSFMTRGKRNE